MVVTSLPPRMPPLNIKRKHWTAFSLLCIAFFLVDYVFEDNVPQRQMTTATSAATSVESIEAGLMSALAALEGITVEELESAIAIAVKDHKPEFEFEYEGEGGEAEISVSEDAGRPFIFTFFHQLDHEHKGQRTGMTFSADEALLQAWKEAWYDAGWKPRVLTLKEAAMHPDFLQFNATLHDHMPFGEYDVLCFLRHLAMVEVGGGWMADYDVFPLNPLKNGGHNAFLPNGGKFTAYEELLGPGAVPSLVSGTSREWNRMAHAIYQDAIVHRNEDFWSDFFSFIDLDKERPGLYEIEDAVVPGRKVLTGHHWGPADCKITDGKLAVHFAHDAIARGQTREGETLADRPHIARHWRGMWKQRCDVVPFEDISHMHKTEATEA
uniref:Uncharacterized protein n=1 Tax=Ditylum brightwellii TaxID=49249 RepID=A0A7S2EBM3_9STRA